MLSKVKQNVKKERMKWKNDGRYNVHISRWHEQS